MAKPNYRATFSNSKPKMQVASIEEDQETEKE
jgi:hypothetical protein